MGRLRHTAPSLRLFVPNSLTVCHLSFLPWGVLATSLPLARLLPRRSFSKRYIRSLLRPARPERFPIKLPASASYHSHRNFSFFLSISLPKQSSKLFSFFPSLSLYLFFFFTIILNLFLSLSLGAGDPTLPAPALPEIPFCVSEEVYLSTKVLFFFLRNLREVPTTCFVIFPSKLSYGFFSGRFSASGM
jgi:hypothetical protein